jgi:deoxyribose-phosphate aldolase
MDIAKLVDHTLLKPEATKEQITKLCEEGKRYGFLSVCVNPFWVKFCSENLKGSKIKVCSVSGFPLGANKTESKAKEAEVVCSDGADEVDMVMNIGALKMRDFRLVQKDIEAVRKAIGKDKILKVILETCVLTDQEKIDGAKIVLDSRADFVKTSTGFSFKGAAIEDIRLLKKIVGDKIGVKASGGIRDYQTVMKMVEAGATRIGTSAGAKIMEEATRKKENI